MACGYVGNRTHNRRNLRKIPLKRLVFYWWQHSFPIEAHTRTARKPK